MKNIFWVSLCYKGAHGGGLYLKEDRLIFRTNKLQLPESMKHISIRYEDLDKVSFSSALAIFPAVTINLKDGSSYKFITLSRDKISRFIGSKIKAGVQ